MKSMTGYGRGDAIRDEFTVTVELSTVNRKGLDMRVNYPREYLSLEVFQLPLYLIRSFYLIKL